MRLKPAVCLVGYAYACCVTHEIRAHTHSFRSSQTMKQRQNLRRQNTKEESKLLILLLFCPVIPLNSAICTAQCNHFLCTSLEFLYHYFPGRSYPTQIAFSVLTIAKESLNGWCDWFGPAWHFATSRMLHSIAN